MTLDDQCKAAEVRWNAAEDALDKIRKTGTPAEKATLLETCRSTYRHWQSLLKTREQEEQLWARQ